MIISFEPKFIFIHVPKTGGVSVSRALKHYRYRPVDNYFLFAIMQRLNLLIIPKPALHLASLSMGIPHTTALALKQHLDSKSVMRSIMTNRRLLAAFGDDFEIGNSIFGSFYSFAFVRNPYAWHLSNYNYIIGKRSNPRNADYQTKFRSFEDYVLFLPENERYRLPSQSSFLNNERGEVLVNFVGRFERLQEDFRTVLRHLRIPLVDLPHINQSKPEDFRKRYTPRMVDVISALYADDLKNFGYSFEN